METGDAWHRFGEPVATALRKLIGRWNLEGPKAVPQALAFTSALQGEGVTYLARSMATVLAGEFDRSVCFVDLNWWADEDDDRPGMSELLRGDLIAYESEVATSLPHLMVLPQGKASVEERPWLAQNPRLVTVVEELRSRYDHLVFDLPAQGVCGEALGLTSLADRCVLVVRQGVTTLDQVRLAVDQLAPVDVHIVLNRVSSRVPRFLRERF